VKVKRITAAVAIVTLIPSLALAWYFVQEGSFISRTKQFVRREFVFPGTHVMDHESKFSLKKKILKVSVIGSHLSETDLEHLRSRLPVYKLNSTQLEVAQSTLEEDLEKKIAEKLSSRFSDQVAKKDSHEKQLEVLQSQLLTFTEQGRVSAQITREALLVIPGIKNVHFTYLFDSKDRNPNYVALVQWKSSPGKKMKQKLEQLLRVRLNYPELTVYEIN
jgi:hypothetical protein